MKDHAGGAQRSGKTTLAQSMKGRKITYHKTQYINNYDIYYRYARRVCGEQTLARALILYSYEADIVGLLMSAIEDYSLYSPQYCIHGNQGSHRIVDTD